MRMNRMFNCRNPYQGKAKKVLCVCSAGLLCSPTAAVVLQREYGYNTRAVGIDNSFALFPIDEVILTWADEIVCMTSQQVDMVNLRLKEYKIDGKVICLHIEDDYGYMDPELIQAISESYKKFVS